MEIEEVNNIECLEYNSQCDKAFKSIIPLYNKELSSIYKTAFPNLSEAHINKIVFDKSKDKLFAINSKKADL